MATASNLYANEIYKHHPIALWALDEDLSTAPLINIDNAIGNGSSTLGNGYEAKAYGTSLNTGYYFGTTNTSNSIPLISGSTGATKINTTLMLPSYGFLNSSGKYNTYTFETWIKISEQPYGLTPLITCGDNGLFFYSNSGTTKDTLVLQIGNKFGTYYIKDANKPMLINITYSEKEISTYLNGERIINFSLDESNISLFNNQAIGSYIYLENAYYDCPSIFGHILDSDIFKIRYALGQAISFPQYINKKYGGTAVSIDFNSAGYRKSHNYPQTTSWGFGISDNLKIRNDALVTNKYNLPTFNFSNTEQTVTTFLNSTSALVYSPNSFFKPDSTWSSIATNIEFDSFDILKTDNSIGRPVKAFYMSGYFENPTNSEQIIFKFINGDNYFIISLNGTTVSYRFKYNATTETNLTTQTLSAQTSGGLTVYNFLIGIDIDKFSDTYNKNLKRFFSNPSNIKFYCCGDNDLSVDKTLITNQTPRIKFLTKENLAKRSLLIDSNGMFVYPSVITSGGSSTSEHWQDQLYGSYEVVVYNQNGISLGSEKKPALNTYASWKHRVSLSTLSQNKNNSLSTLVPTLDFIQFNIDYPTPIFYNGQYFSTQYFLPVKAYITFQYSSNKEYVSDSSYTVNSIALPGWGVAPSTKRTIIPDSSWETSKYQVYDDFAIYFPPGIDYNLLDMVIHLDFSVQDATYRQIELNYIQLSPVSLDAISPTRIKTKYGQDIIPYTYTLDGSGNQTNINYKNKNPFIINKVSQPLLNMSRQSGIRLVGNFDAASNGFYRALKIPLNENLSPSYNITGIQTFVYYEGLGDGYNTPTPFSGTTPVKIFELKSKYKTHTFYLSSTDYVPPSTTGTDTVSGKIYAVSSNGIVDENIKYYINGVQTSTPTINNNEWAVLGIVFTDTLEFDSYSGYFNIVGPVSIDNLSYYQTNNFGLTQYLINRTWNHVLHPYTPALSSYSWSYWNQITWNDLLTEPNPQKEIVNLPDIYNIYTNTNKLTSDTDDLRKLSIYDEKHVYYQKAEVQTFIVNPT